ncbi:MAG: hypothetical protein ACTSYL_04045 [Candidatus Thorarchaeota archaeon]
MLPESELNRMAGESQRGLVSEFQEKYTNLRTRAFRVPIDHARRIAEEYDCPLQVAIIAYLIDMDNILNLRNAIDLIAFELQRRALVREEIPNIPGNILEFAINEGKWIEYIYGKFSREMEIKTRNIANLESALNTENATAEQALIVLRERSRVAGGIIAPLVQEWLKEHPKSTSKDALVAFGPALTKWPRATFLGRLPVLRRRNQALFRLLLKVLATASDSTTVDSIMGSVRTVIEDLSQDLSKLSPLAVGHLLLHMVPKPLGRGDKSRYIEFGAASTRGSKAEPDMTSPYDFLERDIYLAKRRPDEEQERYLVQRISRVLHVLEYQEISLEDAIAQILDEIATRFKVDSSPIGEYTESVVDELRLAPIDQRETQAARFVFKFINDNIYNR